MKKLAADTFICTFLLNEKKKERREPASLFDLHSKPVDSYAELYPSVA